MNDSTLIAARKEAHADLVDDIKHHLKWISTHFGQGAKRQAAAELARLCQGEAIDHGASVHREVAIG